MEIFRDILGCIIVYFIFPFVAIIGFFDKEDFRKFSEFIKKMTSPYRIANVDSFPKIMNVFPHEKDFNCPACKVTNRKELYDGKEYVRNDAFVGCYGKKSFFSRKQLCPSELHLHVKCWACQLHFMMWTK